MNFVRDLMIYATNFRSIHQDATIKAAILMLKDEHGGPIADGGRLNHAELLVFDKDDLIIGKLSAREIVRNMNPIFHSQQGAENMAYTAVSGLTSALLKSLTQNSPLRCKSFELICQHVPNLKIKDCMLPPTSNESVLETDLLEDAIHNLDMGAHQTLLVTSTERFVGIFRLSDVFQQLNQERENSNRYSPRTNKIGD